ncbi:MAG: hypothetical protein J5720_08000 [Bacteroidaceae bacterium]|nr:hypothetical protein [Bacteroidaceae bacterium]
MNSKLIKLDAPYNLIYAGGKVGWHIATLMVWNDDEEAPGGIMDAASYPVIDEGEEFPAGTLCEYAELHDCRVLCSYSEKRQCHATNLLWVMKHIEYDYQQLEPAGPEYILERMKLLGCQIVMPTEKDKETGEELPVMRYDAHLDVMCIKGFGGDKDDVYHVRSNRFDGFYFESEGTEKEIYNDLSYQLHVYQQYFYDDLISIQFLPDCGLLMKATNRLNADQHIEGFKHDDNADWY